MKVNLMKKLMLALLFGLVLPITAMDDTTEFEQIGSQAERTLTDEEFYNLIYSAPQILKDLVQEKTTYALLVALVQSHEKYKEFKPHIETVAQDFDISYFSKIEYDPETKKFLSFSAEQKDFFIQLSKMAIERDTYKHANDLLETTLTNIKAEEARSNESTFCTIL